MKKQLYTYVEAELADVVPGEDLGRLLVAVDPHASGADGKEHAARTLLALAAAQPVEVSVERRLQEHRLPDVRQLSLLPGQAAVVPVLGRKHAQGVLLVAHLQCP